MTPSNSRNQIAGQSLPANDTTSGDIAANKGADTRRGSNLLGVRNYNERLIIDIISQHGELSKADITRITKLSAQTATVIVNNLIENGLLLKNPAERGRVGQPSTPISLNPDGATSIGIKLGRRSVDIIAMSFTNDIIYQDSLFYDYPDVETVFGWIEENFDKTIGHLTPIQRQRLTGVGVANPFHLDAWEGIIRAPKGAMKNWASVNVKDRIERLTGLPVFQLNDASAACLAELKLVQKSANTSFLYFYIGTFLGGGVVIDGKLHRGYTGNAGSPGSMPQSVASAAHKAPSQMVGSVATHDLERYLIEAGYERGAYFYGAPLDHDQEAYFADWARRAASGLAFVIISGQAFLDSSKVIIDGQLSPALLDRLIALTNDALAQYDHQGIDIPHLIAGSLGLRARATGGAILPLHESFAIKCGITLTS